MNYQWARRARQWDRRNRTTVDASQTAFPGFFIAQRPFFLARCVLFGKVTCNATGDLLKERNAKLAYL